MDDHDLPAVDPFFEMYSELKQHIQEDVDIHNRDLTELRLAYYKDKIESGELINTAIRGEPGKGKSLLALNEELIINDIMGEKHNRKIDCYKAIASDQNEFIRLVKDGTVRNSCAMIDEFNPMGRTGANATTEEAEYEFFSDLCRIYYVHRIACAPKRINDPNVNLIYDVVTADKANKRTYVKVTYYHPLENRAIPLGSMWVDVSRALESEEYKKYELKKMMRVDLLNKYGVRDVRELEFADIGVDVIKAITPMIKDLGKQDIKGLIVLKCINLMQEKYKRPMSFIAKDEIIEQPYIILSQLKTMTKMKGKEAETFFKEEIAKSYQRLIIKKKLLEKYVTIE